MRTSFRSFAFMLTASIEFWLLWLSAFMPVSEPATLSTAPAVEEQLFFHSIMPAVALLMAPVLAAALPPSVPIARAAAPTSDSTLFAATATRFIPVAT
ncbi:MAG: hypothetical protein BGP09_33405 [Rhizobium sp. 60-20]|nr:MAG: hypothetical protein BGP09_33405 [Rhizobium sp. 60-20]